MPGVANLAIYQGDDYAALVTVTNGTAAPADVLAGYSAQAQIRTDPADDADVVVDIEATVNSPNITLYIPAAQTVQMCGEYIWDLQIVDAAGLITTILAGSVTVTPEVTR